MDGRRKWDMRAVRAREARVEHPFWRVVDDRGVVMMLGLTLAQANEMVRTRVGAARVVRDPNWREPLGSGPKAA